MTINELPDHLLARGRHCFTSNEVEQLLGKSRQAILQGLHRLLVSRKIFSPAQGLYIIIPPQYRNWGVVPADLFINDWMNYAGCTYYVGLLTAAAFHGASHHAPQIYQVMVNRQRRDWSHERIHVRFYTSTQIRTEIEWALEQRNVASGSIWVSNPSLTALDLVNRPKNVGGLNNVATVLAELDLPALDDVGRLSRYFSRSVIRRLGWLLENQTPGRDLSVLREAARPGAGVPVLLDSRGPRRGKIDASWGIRINALIEPDV